MLSPGCPWADFSPAVLNFCEANLCSWVRQPANTYSNISYLAVGTYVLLRTRRQITFAVRAIGIAAILIGLTSAFYHASGTYIGEVMDLGSMFLFSSILVTLNLIRLDAIPKGLWVPFYVLLNLISMGLLLLTRTIGIYIFAGHVLLFLALEVRLMRVQQVTPKYRDLLIGLGLFLVSYAIWLLDFHHIVCDPNQHIFQGHALWHITNSFVFWFTYRFYLQFDEIFQGTPVPISN